MLLRGLNGNSVELSIVGYQFPGMDAAGDGVWDANWLQVDGEVVHEGRKWSFRDPCLTTWELRAFARWMREISTGERLPSAEEPIELDVNWCSFTEPNIAFAFTGASDDAVEIRVYLSAEALPELHTHEIYEYFVPINMSRGDMAVALAAAEASLTDFPERR